jgi:PAS domain S-box-containing protein
LIDNIQDGVYIIQNNKILFANDAFARMTGYSLNDAIGMDFRKLVAPEDRENGYRALQSPAKG